MTLRELVDAIKEWFVHLEVSIDEAMTVMANENIIDWPLAYVFWGIVSLFGGIIIAISLVPNLVGLVTSIGSFVVQSTHWKGISRCKQKASFSKQDGWYGVFYSALWAGLIFAALTFFALLIMFALMSRDPTLTTGIADFLAVPLLAWVFGVYAFFIILVRNLFILALGQDE